MGFLPVVFQVLLNYNSTLLMLQQWIVAPARVLHHRFIVMKMGMVVAPLWHTGPDLPLYSSVAMHFLIYTLLLPHTEVPVEGPEA
jgi:hypothetical protein